jgi:hypothetical protein
MLHWSREKENVQTDESERVAELERLVGRLTMELEIANALHALQRV